MNDEKRFLERVRDAEIARMKKLKEPELKQYQINMIIYYMMMVQSVVLLLLFVGKVVG